ncbi:MAG TPA: hypothetical protein VE861_11935 [Gemmatimonadaceae bacterium]|nr:hypothetical protein [Gemmatimonadaceae bacterium]
MRYVKHRQRDSIPALFPLLFATGTLAVLAILWRRRAAPRAEERVTRKSAGTHDVERAPRSTGPDTQTASRGAGPLIHRRYEVELPDRAMSREVVLHLMQRHLTELAPSALADFQKSEGSANAFKVGDEYSITMLGPWNGAVRVAEITSDSFTLVTLDGHPEAGHITFGVHEDAQAPLTLRVVIESWARSRDALVSVAYGTLGIGKQVQTEVWITFLQRLAELAGVTTRPEVSITTETLPEEAVKAVDAAV